ncbi:MAG: UDP-4-amino-4,6-dideoxy-N-acetyl-beta-L-altrosamine N-acetyltransferase [Eubacterium sp.]|nr:UDP-4-amino-4,6-dideoxy-N-acetyl-beta-L-altrosamine N-acetyltransferase [Eubacterium sp.]
MNISLRDIRGDDLEMIMKWRMDPDITRYMNTNPKLTLEGQRKWLASLESNSKVKYWLIEKDLRPIGVINMADIDYDNKNSSWGYYIGEKDARSLKLAISLEMSLYDYVFDVLGFEELHNEVFSLNSGVVKLHLACGSHITKEVKDEVDKEGISYDITHISITSDEWNAIKLSKKYEKINFDIMLEPHHIGYAVADIKRAIDKYNKLGYYQETGIYEDEDRNVRITFMVSRLSDTRIELIQPMGDKSPVTDTLKHSKNMSTPYHICYTVKSLENEISELKKRGFMMTKMPAPAVAFKGRRVVFMLNRDAGLIELVEEISD